uniref:Uncharacterized protein n=1 Tax=Amphimedon queenslandica TaxID=400682 RepID=A0A1X7TP30_AMPQE
MSNPEVGAKREPLAAATSIEAALMYLSKLLLFHFSLIQTTDAHLNFDAQILEAAKSIAAATKSLAKLAAELACQLHVCEAASDRAGQQVKKATETLVKAAKDSADNAKERKVDAFEELIRHNASLIKNPIKLIVRVLCYARKHKYPENRSAPTYWEEEAPSRLDLGKDKYGGPFTEEEVEDVKTFFHMLPIFIAIFGFGLISTIFHGESSEVTPEPL